MISSLFDFMLVIMAINFFDYGNVMIPIMNKSSFAFTRKSSSLYVTLIIVIIKTSGHLVLLSKTFCYCYCLHNPITFNGDHSVIPIMGDLNITQSKAFK